MLAGCGFEGLCRDLNADEDKNRCHSGLGQEANKKGEIAADRPQADEKRGGNGVPERPPNLLVGRVADVWAGLDHAAAQPWQQGGKTFHQQDIAGTVVITGGGRTFSHIHSAHYRCQSKRDYRPAP